MSSRSGRASASSTADRLGGGRGAARGRLADLDDDARAGVRAPVARP